MREILFRGKRVDNGEWVYGFLSKSRGNNHLLSLCIDYEEKGVMISSVIEPKTLGQYTGLTDKNGKKIFEGDIVKENDIFHNGELQIRGNTLEVVFDDGLFFANFKDISVYLKSLDGMEVIGNIHDNL